MLTGHMWWVSVIMGSTIKGHFYHGPMSCWTTTNGGAEGRVRSSDVEGERSWEMKSLSFRFHCEGSAQTKDRLSEGCGVRFLQETCPWHVCGIDSPGTQWVLILAPSVLGQLWGNERALRRACLHTAFFTAREARSCDYW